MEENCLRIHKNDLYNLEGNLWDRNRDSKEWREQASDNELLEDVSLIVDSLDFDTENKMILSMTFEIIDGNHRINEFLERNEDCEYLEIENTNINFLDWKEILACEIPELSFQELLNNFEEFRL